MSSVEIIVGHRWKDDVRYIDSLQPRRPAESGLNLLELRDIIDIVVDGTNLTASICEEAIFGLVEDVLASLVKLVDETSCKGIIEFHHEPWELVLIPDGSELRLSLYTIDRRRRVITRDRRVNARAFIDAFCVVAEQMLTDLFGLSERFSADPQVRQISQSLAYLKRSTRRQPFSTSPVRDDRSEEPRVASTSDAGGLTLGYRFDVGDEALNSYQGEHLFDLHALLFDGVLVAEFGPRSLILCRSYPFLAMASLVDRTRQLFNQLESHANAPFVLDEELSHLDLTIQGQGQRWILRARDLDQQQWHQWSVHPAGCLDTLVSLAELFVQDVTRANQHQKLNHRFVDLAEEVERLRHWHRDLCGNNLYHDRPEDYLRRLGHVEPQTAPVPSSGEFPWPLSSVHTLFPRRAWSLYTERIDFESIVLTPESLLVATPEAIQCIDPQKGHRMWRYELDVSCEFDAIMTGAGNYVVATGGDRRLHIVNRHCGELQTTVETDVPWRQLGSSAHYTDPNITVISQRSGDIIGVDHESGQIQWNHSTSPGHLIDIVFNGPLASVQSSEGVVTTLNPSSGDILWRIRLGGTPELPMSYHQGRLYVITHEPLHHGSTLYALYPFTGRTVWQLRLPGYVCGPPSFIDHSMVVALERHGKLVLAGIDLEAVDPRTNWQIELSSAGVDRPTSILPVEYDGGRRGLVRTDRAELTCFDICSGEVHWRVVPAAETLLLHGNLPLFQIRDAVVNVCQTVDLRELSTGRLLHSFEAIEAPEFGFLAPPFCLLLGERAPGGDEADQLTAYCVEHFLALLQ